MRSFIIALKTVSVGHRDQEVSFNTQYCKTPGGSLLRLSLFECIYFVSDKQGSRSKRSLVCVVCTFPHHKASRWLWQLWRARLVLLCRDHWRDSTNCLALSCHNATKYHEWSNERVFEFQNRSKCGAQADVRCLQNAARLQVINNNRHVLKSIIEMVILCARQNIPLRGHRDSGRITSDEDTDINEGNFRALLRFRVRSGDDVLRRHLSERAVHQSRSAKCLT